MTKYLIEVDDEDVDQAPDSPWTATIRNGKGDALAVGLGETLDDAVQDALANPLEDGQ